ncbi:MAG TPA: CHAT domain-containing protein [Pyrinomonadaceae bacterium]|jgi:CHAT domain-containing protein|nr:CHAT domain-containing protein [Pyrinomonadaceae bacterium]
MKRVYSDTSDRSTRAARRILLGFALAALCFASRPAPTRAQAPMTTQATTMTQATASDVEAVPLPTPGAAAARELRGGETHAYEVALRAGQFLSVSAEQKELNLRLSFFDPAGRVVLSVNWETGVRGTERACVLAEGDGVYRLEVKPQLTEAPPGAYALTAGEARDAGEADRRRFAAERLMAEAEEMQAQQTAATRSEALRKYHEAAALFAELGDREREATVLMEAGVVTGITGQRKAALEMLERGLEIAGTLPDRSRAGQILASLTNVHYRSGDLPKALDCTRRSLEIFREVGDRRWITLALGNHAVVMQAMGDTPAAVEQQLQVLRMRRELGERVEVAITLNNLGRNYSELGEMQKALDHLHQSLALYRSLGRTETARARAVAALNNLGVVYSELGEHRQALAHQEEALAAVRAAGDRNLEPLVLVHLGRARAGLGDAAAAREDYMKALAQAREVGNRKAEALALQSLGQSALAAGEFGRAVEHLGGALALDRAGASRKREAETLTLIGTAYRLAGDRAKALEQLRQALAIGRDIGDPTVEARALGEEARLELGAGNLAGARAAVESALARVEAIRGKLAGRQLRTAYFASAQSYYRLHVETLMALHRARPSEGFDAQALHASERARARGLLELLAEAGVDVRRGGDPGLLARERALRLTLSAKADQHLRALAGSAPKGEHVTALTKEIAALADEYEQVQARIRQASPRYAALTQPAPAGLREIQSTLDPDTLLLEYSLGESRSYLWVVSHDGLASYELPARAEVERAARAFYDLLTAPNSARADARPSDGEARLASAGEALSRMVLAPAAPRLGAKRLLVVGDGALNYVPFSALPDAGGTPLVVGHEVVALPSATTLGVLRRELEGRAPAPKALAVIADPVFSAADPRLKSAAGRTPRAAEGPADGAGARAAFLNVSGPHELVTRAFGRADAPESGAAGIARLPFSRREAEAIYGLAPEGQALKALDFSASRETVEGGALSQYRVVHFATHGLLNGEHPELSGIVLSLFDRQGRPADGFLRLGDVYNLSLPAELVVLSACQTGLGKEVQGEGLVGLTRGFVYAGAARVAASLWKVDDAGTAELMRRFYGGMFRDGLRPAAALRAAKVEMMKQTRWRSPYYWAAFELQGEWR